MKIVQCILNRIDSDWMINLYYYKIQSSYKSVLNRKIEMITEVR